MRASTPVCGCKTKVLVAKGESAGTALVVAAFYRFAVLAPNKVTQDHFGIAEQAFNGVMKKVDEAGWLGQVS